MADKQFHQFDPNPGNLTGVILATQRQIGANWKTERLTSTVLIAQLQGLFEVAGAVADHLAAYNHDGFATIAEINGIVGDHEAKVNPHPIYLTQAEGDGRYPLQTALAESIDDRVAALLVAGDNITLAYNDVTGRLTITSTNAGGTGGGHTIQDETTDLTQRAKLAFVGPGVSVTDDPTNDRTVATFSSSSSGSSTTLELPNQSVDPAPIAGTLILFSRADNLPYVRKSDGTVYPITLGASVPPIVGGGNTYTENFTYANGLSLVGQTFSLGTWGEFFNNSSPVINANKATPGVANSSSASGALIQTNQTTYSIEADFNTPQGGGNYGSLGFRAAAASTANGETWFAYVVNNTLNTGHRTSAGVFTAVDSVPFTVSGVYRLKVAVTPGGFDVFVDNTLYISSTSTLYAANTFAGFNMYQPNAANEVDNLVISW